MDAPPALDFDHFHREALPPRLAAGNGALAARAALGLGSLAFRMPDGVFAPEENARLADTGRRLAAAARRGRPGNIRD